MKKKSFVKFVVLFIVLLLQHNTFSQNVSESNLIVQYDIPFLIADHENSNLAMYDYMDRSWECDVIEETFDFNLIAKDETQLKLRCEERDEPENFGDRVSFIATLKSTGRFNVNGTAGHGSYIMRCTAYDYETDDGIEWKALMQEMNNAIYAKGTDAIGTRDARQVSWKNMFSDRIGFRLIERRDPSIVRQAKNSAKFIVDCGLYSDDEEEEDWDIWGSIHMAETTIELEPYDVSIYETTPGDARVIHDETDEHEVTCSYNAQSRRGVPRGFSCGSVHIAPHVIKMPWSAEYSQISEPYEIGCQNTGEELAVDMKWVHDFINSALEGDLLGLTDRLLSLEEHMVAQSEDDLEGYYLMASKVSLLDLDPGTSNHYIAISGPVRFDSSINFREFIQMAQNGASVDDVIETVSDSEFVIKANGCVIAPQSTFADYHEKALVNNASKIFMHVTDSMGYAKVTMR